MAAYSQQPQQTFYAVDTGRGKKALLDINILPNFNGRAIHNVYSTYPEYSCDHGL